MVIESRNMDWVERRAARDAIVRGGAERLWEHLWIAIDHARESYNKHYGREFSAFCTRPYPDRIAFCRESKATRDTVASVAIVRDATGAYFEGSYRDQLTPPTRIDVDCSDNDIYLKHQSERIDVETASERLLAPVLFP